MNRKTILIALISIVVLGCVSCKPKQHIDLSKQSMVFSPRGGTDLFTITADCDWTIEVDNGGDWITLSQTSGSKDANVSVKVGKYTGMLDRNTSLTVVSANGKVKKTLLVTQTKYDIKDIVGKAWFLRYYERWDTNYYYELIEDTYQSWTYYSEEGYENWFLFFTDDKTGYQMHTKQGDTVYYSYDYRYYPDGDSLYINFETSDGSVEDYHCLIYQVDDEMFVFSNEWWPHRFEKLTNYNVTYNKSRIGFHPDPNKVMNKPKGPFIQIEP